MLDHVIGFVASVLAPDFSGRRERRRARAFESGDEVVFEACLLGEQSYCREAIVYTAASHVSLHVSPTEVSGLEPHRCRTGRGQHRDGPAGPAEVSGRLGLRPPHPGSSCGPVSDSSEWAESRRGRRGDGPGGRGADLGPATVTGGMAGGRVHQSSPMSKLAAIGIPLSSNTTTR